MTSATPVVPNSPTEATTMPPPSRLPLTLILAATPTLGIGRAGGLPWPQLRKEMAYFRRVTSRVTATNSPPPEDKTKRLNAVIMGRKTWDSIPPRFRPLEGRVNVVVTRGVEAFREKLDNTSEKEEEGKGKGDEGPIVVGSLDEAVEKLTALSNASSGIRAGPEQRIQIERAFVIGGATIYNAALQLEQTDRVLLTRIETEYECDTFFGVDLDKGGWRRCEDGETEEWTGESVGETVEEKGVRFKFGMWVRA